MRKAFLFLLLVLHLPAWGSQIVVGLRSDNLVSWSVWERQDGALKHYLLLFNKGQQAMEVKVKLKRFSSDGSHFTDVYTNQTFFRLKLGAQQLVRLKYPKKLLASDYTEYFENGQSIGLLPATTARPGNAVLNDSCRFYTDQGLNARYLGYWVAFESIYALPKRIILTAAHTFYPASETLKQEYHLVKLYPDLHYQYPRGGTLDSLYAAGADAAIVRLDSAHPSAVVPVRADFAASGFAVFAVYIEQVSDGYNYDEAKRLVPNKSFGASIGLIPVFPPPR